MRTVFLTSQSGSKRRGPGSGGPGDLNDAGPGSGRPARDAPDTGQLELLLGHVFKQKNLLVKALTHSSLAYESAAAEPSGKKDPIHAPPEEADNEQLEFLGDAVVGLLVAESLCKQRPDLEEGQLTRLRAALVSRRQLGEVGALLCLGDYMRLGRGEERSGGRKKKAILANCIEAVIGAVYLDAGLNTTRLFVERYVVAPYLAALLEQMKRVSTIGDHKSTLQELLQGRGVGTPLYSVKSESGPDHRKRFVVEVSVPASEAPDRPLASGMGSTKKKAEQEAARRAFELLTVSAKNQDIAARATTPGNPVPKP